VLYSELLARTVILYTAMVEKTTENCIFLNTKTNICITLHCKTLVYGFQSALNDNCNGYTYMFTVAQAAMIMLKL